MSFADSGVRTVHEGHLPKVITLAEAANPGDLLGYSSGWKLADASTGVAIGARLVALQKGAIGDEIGAVAIAKVDGFTGATVGGKMYASETAGDYTQAEPTDVGDLVQCVGYAVSATEALVSLVIPNEAAVAGS